MDRGAIAAAARAVDEARRAKQVLPDLAGIGLIGGEADGYAVQAAVHALRPEPAIGWKIGCTNAVMQDMLGIPGPAVGRMTMRLAPGAELLLSDFIAPGVECEIAFRLSADLPGERDYDRYSIADAVDAAMASLEVVDNRYGDIPSRPVGEMIADDFFHTACLFGPPVTDWRSLDLAALRGMSEKDGVVQGEGISNAVLGHPLSALAWAANILATQGRPLLAGQIVTTGTIAPVLWVDGPGTYAIAVESLGRNEITFV